VKKVVTWTLLVLLAVVIAGGAWLYTSLRRPYKGYEASEQFVEIPPGTGTAGMGRRLAEAGVVRSAQSFRAGVWLRGSGRRLQAGEYRFDRPMTVAEVVDKIARGDVYVRALTFREGLTIREMAAVFESAGYGSAADFVAASRNAALVRDFDPEAKDLEGYLFPDTYTLPRRTTAAQLVERMVSRFQKVLTSELRSRAAERGFTVRQVVTLASLVEKETAKAEERPVVAGVYANRLEMGWGCSATRPSFMR
jgi:UPF0755 protein